MPFTPKQRRLFHAKEEHPDKDMSAAEAHKLAQEADDLARQGKEKKPKKSTSKGFIDLTRAW